ncbi:excisionase [Burkholderia phage vB_BceS_AH2]|uniref:Excisionase n=1 Tax=Burkholderia phage vB_BceS_AH2 TaxID=1133022 RepID=I6NTP5_9CAUD|nr:excisionase [Burkholderia phage vB_BceS_AH2]AEY69579.1 excisionase [Burkholderia phage vB_BceS_AH2]
MTLESARNAVAAGRFPVPTYKLGKLIVIDRAVHEEFFASKRRAGLLALRNNKKVNSQPEGDSDE